MHLKTIIFVLGVAAGITIGFVSPFATEMIVAAMALAMMQGIILLVSKFWKREQHVEDMLLPLYIFLFSFGIIAGALRVQFVEEKNPYVCESSCVFDATIISSPETKDTYQVFTVRPVDLPAQAEVEVAMYDVQIRAPLYPRFKIGETLRVEGKALLPSVIMPHNGEKSFDYVSYLHTKNIGSEMMFPSVEVVDSEAHSVQEYLGRWKEDLIARLGLYVSSPASTLASGMLFGDSSMSKELTQTFRTSGLSHIVVLSGFNIAIVITSILFVFMFVPLVMRIALASFFVVMFVMMVGGEASVMRATAMAFIGLLATLLGRAYVARQALIISFLAIILYEPQALRADASLHLSFLATAGIVYASGPLEKILQKYMKNKYMLSLFTTTLAAYFATLPYVMYTFGTVSLYALIANVLVLPLIPITMLLSFIVVCMSYLPAQAGMFVLFVGFVDTFVSNIILFVARTVEALPFSNSSLSVSFTSMCSMYVGVSLLVIYLHNKKNETMETTTEGYLTDIIKY